MTQPGDTDHFVIALSGGIGSGKTTIAKALAAHLQCPIASFGNYVRAVAAAERRPLSRQELQKISQELFDVMGMESLVRQVLTASGWNGRESLVIDGVRRRAAVNFLRDEIAGIPLLHMHLDVCPEARAKRLVRRGDLSMHDLDRAEVHFTEEEVGTKLAASANTIIDANGNIPDTFTAAIQAIEAWRATAHNAR